MHICQVWIHGGAFRTGIAGLYEGSTFVAVGGVILVTINYRLSALGFLTTGDDRLKGSSSITGFANETRFDKTFQISETHKNSLWLQDTFGITFF